MLSRKSFGTLAVASGLLWAGSAQAVINIDLVPVGDAGNTADIADGDIYTSGIQRYGRVDYAYNIGKYEVTAGQYTAFLNAVAKTDTFGLYDSRMAGAAEPLHDFGCNIQRQGTEGNYSYTVASYQADYPVNYVCFWNACRFANWLSHGQPVGLQNASTTEDGTYSLAPVGIANNAITRNAGATWAVANENEWYKAAYYKGGSLDAGYWAYPTRSNSKPGRSIADASGNNANYFNGSLPIAPSTYITKVGQFAKSQSSYGTFDQGGNLWEWNETSITGGESDSYGWSNDYGSHRGLRGGSWNSGYYSNTLRADDRSSIFPDYADNDIGFRLVLVPEPASIGLLGMGVMGMLMRRRGAAK